MSLEIGLKLGGVGSKLSNMNLYPFIFEGVAIASMEGFLQGLKFENQEKQREVCRMLGMAARRRGRSRNEVWRNCQLLWWQGRAVPRNSKEYQDLLRRAYRSMFDQSERFRSALIASGDEELTHEIGTTSSKFSVLTRDEFLGILNWLRQVAVRARANAYLLPAQKELARHALGLPNKERQSYRNHFCASPDHEDYQNWADLVGRGMAVKYKSSLFGGDDVFRLTIGGARLALLPGEKLSPGEEQAMLSEGKHGDS